ncbi:hypothetical protein D6D05_05165 [Aureobasidium pullulans]|nr:hypothetical protein D6D05_05165 [Aureobasidium pullulans]
MTVTLDTTGYRKSLSKRSGLEKYGIGAAGVLGHALVLVLLEHLRQEFVCYLYQHYDEKKMNAGKSLEMISLEHKISELERRFEKKAREMAEIWLVKLRMDKLENEGGRISKQRVMMIAKVRDDENESCLDSVFDLVGRYDQNRAFMANEVYEYKR